MTIGEAGVGLAVMIFGGWMLSKVAGWLGIDIVPHFAATEPREEDEDDDV